MKNYFKYAFVLALLILAMAFAGCTDVKITASIDEDSLMTYSYSIFITGMEEDDVNYKETRNLLTNMVLNFREAGFTAKSQSTSAGLELNAEIKKECETREQAFDELYKCMTNSVSPFIDVEYEYNQNFYYEDYFLKAHINLDGVVDEAIYEVYPTVIGADVDKLFEGLNCTVIITLPENQTEDSDELSENVLSQEILTDRETEVFISGRINNNVNVRYEENLLAKKDKQRTTLIVLASAAALALVVLAVIIILRKKAKKAETDETDETAKTDETPEQSES